MNHSEAIKLLPWYVNSTLSDQEREEVQGHVEHCETCKAEINQLAMLQETVQETSAQESFVPSDDLFERLMEKIDEEESGSSRFQSLLQTFQRWTQGQVFVPVAAAVLLLIVGYQSLIVIPGLQTQVERLSQVQSTLSVVLPPAVRGTSSDISVGEQESFLHLIMDINATQEWDFLFCQFLTTDGEIVIEERVEFSPDTLSLLVPVSKLLDGEYTLIISGQNAGESELSEISRYRFNLDKH